MTPSTMQQLPLAMQVTRDSVATFDNFHPGANAAAVAYLRALASSSVSVGAQAASGAVPPVFLWGPEGAGKSHLLHALARSHEAVGGQVLWFGHEPRAGNPSPSLVVFDDCHRYDASAQQEAFACFIDATDRRVQVAAAATMPPVDLPLRDDLRTRLGWGPIFAIEPLGEVEARAALRVEAERRGVALSDEVLNYLLTRFHRDLKSLVTLLERLDTYGLAHKRAVTVPLLKQMLAESAKPS